MPYTGQPSHGLSEGLSAGTVMAGGPPPLVVKATEQALADPVAREALRQQAESVGKQVGSFARHYGHRGLMAFQEYIQQGPQGISTLCFIGGVGTSVLGVMTLTSVGDTIRDPFHYVLSAYLGTFGLATVVIEADTDRIGMMIMPFDRLAGPITSAQAWLHEECRLLTQLRGRGLFYLYQGTLLVTQCAFCLNFMVGLYVSLMGLLCISISFGYKPDIEGMVIATGGAVQGAMDSGRPRYAMLQEDIIAQDKIALEQGLKPVANWPVQGSPTIIDLIDEFPRAEEAYEAKKDTLQGRARRELWALLQQATLGDCTEAKPSGMFNGNAKEQWRLWNGLKSIPSDDAKIMFVERLQREHIQI